MGKKLQAKNTSFSQVYSMGEDPEKMPEFSITSMNNCAPTLLNILSESELFESKGQIRRLFKQGSNKT